MTAWILQVIASIALTGYLVGSVLFHGVPLSWFSNASQASGDNSYVDQYDEMPTPSFEASAPGRTNRTKIVQPAMRQESLPAQAPNHSVADNAAARRLFWSIRPSGKIYSTDPIKPLWFSSVVSNGSAVVSSDIYTSLGPALAVFNLDSGKARHFVGRAKPNSGWLGDQRHVSLSNNGLLALATPGDVQVWNLETQELLRVFPTMSHEVYHVDFSGDGSQLVASAWRHVIVWDLVEDNDPLHLSHDALLQPDNPDRNDYLAAGFFTPDGREVVTISSLGNIFTWDLASRSLVRTIALREEGSVPIRYPRRSLHSSRIAMFKRAPHPYSWKLVTYDSETAEIVEVNQLNKLTRGKRSLPLIALSPDGDKIAITADSEVYLWNLDGDRQQFPFSLSAPGMIAGIDWSHDGQTIVVQHEDRHIPFYSPLMVFDVSALTQLKK